jgi:hypothetical protein
MKHDVGSLGLTENTTRQAPIDFPSRLIEPDHEDNLGSIRCVMWCFVFEIAVCLAVAFVWRLWLSLH